MYMKTLNQSLPFCEGFRGILTLFPKPSVISTQVTVPLTSYGDVRGSCMLYHRQQLIELSLAFIGDFKLAPL